MKTLLRLAFVALLSTSASAQWANVPPPAVPRTPDLSGIWSPPPG